MKLTFKTKPSSAKVALGNEITGVIEVPTYGAFLPAELALIESFELPDRRKQITVLAKKLQTQINEALPVSAESKQGEGFAPKRVTLVELYYAIYAWVFEAASLTIDQINLIGDQLEALNELRDGINKDIEQKSRVYALAILKGRLGQECAIEELAEPKTIHPAMVDRLATFAYLEEQGIEYDEDKQYGAPTETETLAAELTEQDLGKS